MGTILGVPAVTVFISNLVADKAQRHDLAVLVYWTLADAKAAALAMKVVHLFDELPGSTNVVATVLQNNCVLWTILPALQAMDAIFAMGDRFPGAPGSGLVLGGAARFQNDSAVGQILPVF
jgi:hypothetical protein